MLVWNVVLVLHNDSVVVFAEGSVYLMGEKGKTKEGNGNLLIVYLVEFVRIFNSSGKKWDSQKYYLK